MAPVEPSPYLPPLDQCLNGGKQLLSWRSALTALTEDTWGDQKTLQHFIVSKDAQDVLIELLKPRNSAPASGKSQFDAYTSAISIPSNSDGSYDLQQLKDDALWLSGTVKINELSALRVVLLEWQSRARSQLLSSDSWEDGPIFSGSTRLKSSLLLSRTKSPREVGQIPMNFGSDEARRVRSLHVFFSERQCQYKMLSHIIFSSLCERAAPADAQSRKSVDKQSMNTHNLALVVLQAGRQLLEALDIDKNSKGSRKHWLVETTLTIGQSIEAIFTGMNTEIDEIEREAVESQWCETYATGIIHLMHIVSIIVHSAETLMTAESVSHWFSLMDQFGFFSTLELPFQALNDGYVYDIRCHACIATLAIINTPAAVEVVPALSSGAPTNTDPSTAIYLQDVSCIEQITTTLLNGAGNMVPYVKPLSLAWSIVLQDIRGYADSSSVARDNRLAQRAIDSIGASAISDTESVDGSTERRRSSPNRRASFGSDTSQQLTFLEEIVDMLQKLEPADDVINLLARSAFQSPGAFVVLSELALKFCGSFGLGREGRYGLRTRSLLLELTAASLGHVDYQPDLVSTVLAILTGGRDYWAIMSNTSQVSDIDIARQFLQDPRLKAQIFDTALARFPFESVPFLQLCQALAISPPLEDQMILPMKSILDNIQCLTLMFYEEDTSYDLRGEGDNMYIVLTSPLDLFATIRNTKQGQPRHLPSLMSSPEFTGSEAMVLPIGTPGRTLTENKPLVVMFRYPYSGLSYMGLILKQALEARSNGWTEVSESTSEIATEIINLLSRMLATASSLTLYGKSFEDSQNMARAVLEEASAGLGRNQDIVSLILEIFEDELYDQKSGAHSALATDLLVRSIEFIHSLLLVLPGRVWPFLGRSGFLGLKGTESRLVHVVATLEVPAGQFPFLLSTTRLFEALVDDAVLYAISRKTQTSNNNRFDPSVLHSLGSGITEALMRKILLNYEKIMIDIFESISNWRFLETCQRLDINTVICRTFKKTITYCYDTDDSNDLLQKISSAIAPSANYLLDVLLSQSSNELPTQPIAHIIHEGSLSDVDTAPPKIRQSIINLVETVLNLATCLVRTNTYLGRPASRLQQQLFALTPAIAKCYSLHDRYRAISIELLDALVRSSGKSSELPPSLLGQLGPQVAKSFIDMLSRLDEPLDNKELERSIWLLLSSVVSERQQWFAMYVLTGNTPKESLKDGSLESHMIKPVTVFDVAISKLRNLSFASAAELIPILQFVSLAADFWPRICRRIQNDTLLINCFLKFLKDLNDQHEESLLHNPDIECNSIQAAGLIANILAILAHRKNEAKDKSFAEQLLPNIKYLIQEGTSTPRYNASLHSRLRKNFEARYPNCRLVQFKRTPATQPELGPSFYYNLEMADTLLKHDSAWTSSSNRGFYNEFVVANRNFSLVEAQMNLFHGWKALAVELGLALGPDGTFRGCITHTIRACLIANAKTSLPEQVFSRLVQARASLAFTLMQRLIEFDKESVDAKSILKPAWEALRDATQDLGLALSGPDAEYVRTLLKILYLALQPHLVGNSSSTHSKSILRQNSSQLIVNILEILRLCAASGFRSLVNLLHEDNSKVNPSDFTLLNGILRTCLRVPGVDKQTEQLLAMFADEKSVFYANTLLSWAHSLIIDQDPIFGELGLIFVLELSTIPVLAEYVVTAGTLGQIVTAEIMNYLRRPGGTGPFDEPARMYHIWTCALLPLAINLLTAIGAPIAGDIGSFLNQFRPQLDRASLMLDTKITRVNSGAMGAGCITLAMASEIHSLALVASILEVFRLAGASAGIATTEVPELAWDAAIVKSDLETRLQRRTALREDIIATDEKEQILSRRKPSNERSGYESELEERIVEDLAATLSLLGGIES